MSCLNGSTSIRGCGGICCWLCLADSWVWNSLLKNRKIPTTSTATRNVPTSRTAKDTTIKRTLTSLCSWPAPLGLGCTECSISVSVPPYRIGVARVVGNQQRALFQIEDEVSQPDSSHSE